MQIGKDIVDKVTSALDHDWLFPESLASQVNEVLVLPTSANVSCEGVSNDLFILFYPQTCARH